MEVIVGVAEKSTEQFIQFFYPNYDTQRQVWMDQTKFHLQILTFLVESRQPVSR